MTPQLITMLVVCGPPMALAFAVGIWADIKDNRAVAYRSHLRRDFRDDPIYLTKWNGSRK